MIASVVFTYTAAAVMFWRREAAKHIPCLSFADLLVSSLIYHLLNNDRFILFTISAHIYYL